MNINGRRLTPVTYRTLPPRKQTIGRTEAVVYGIERKLRLTDEAPLAWDSFFTDNTLMTFRVQVGSPLLMILDRMPLPAPAQCSFEPKPTFEKQPLIITEDVELRSKLIGRKTELKAGYNSYLRHHPDARALLSDFLQSVLLRRPDDVFTFAAKYFYGFSSKPPDLPDKLPDDLSATNLSAPFINLQEPSDSKFVTTHYIPEFFDFVYIQN